ncbi:hypothetical protein AURDEDRAFT_165702 [Auricularia subglabra TFB-10046 SS5]|nr:hypothetical protein AURDEDRAFT_165702 [Auricularia subglabra TFB-10046 SS5]
MLIVDKDIPPLLELSDNKDHVPEESDEPKAPDKCIPIEVYALDNCDRFARPPPHQLFLSATSDDIRHRGLPAIQEDDPGDFTMTVTLTIGDKVWFEMLPRPREVPPPLHMHQETRFHRRPGIIPVGIGELTFAPRQEGEREHDGEKVADKIAPYTDGVAPPAGEEIKARFDEAAESQSQHAWFCIHLQTR